MFYTYVKSHSFNVLPGVTKDWTFDNSSFLEQKRFVREYKKEISNVRCKHSRYLGKRSMQNFFFFFKYSEHLPGGFQR